MVHILYTSLICRARNYRALLLDSHSIVWIWLLNVDALYNTSEQNRALIHEIVEEGDEEDLKVYIFLVQLLPNFLVHKFLRAKDRDGETALHYAASNGKLGMVILLVNADSDLVPLRDDDGKTAKNCAYDYFYDTYDLQVVDYLNNFTGTDIQR